MVVEVDQAGKVVRRIGARRASAGPDDRENQAFVAASGSMLVVAYKYRPAVEVYDLDSGELVRNFEIHHPVFEALKSQAGEAGPTADSAQQKLEPRYVAGVKALGDRIFLCLHLPTPEVWEMNGEGKLLAAYRAEGLPNSLHIFGFDARPSGKACRSSCRRNKMSIWRNKRSLSTTTPAEQSPLPPYTFPRRHSKKIHKTLEAIQDFGVEMFLGVQASIQKHQHNLKLFRISEEKYFAEFWRANRL